MQGYHVQITARSDRDLSPESIVQKVSDASGSRYSGAIPSSTTSAPPAPVSSKPAFTPTHRSAGGGGFNPLSSRAPSDNVRREDTDEDGWGPDAPPVTRTQLEKVPSSYHPTKVNLRGPASENTGSTPSSSSSAANPHQSDVIRGAYQPVGKVDIAALRNQSQQNPTDDRPTPVKGAYEPVGKVDIAAIRARAQPSGGALSSSGDTRFSEPQTGSSQLAQQPGGVSASERLTSLPKPKVANRFGSGSASYAGTKAPTPGGYGLESKLTPAIPPIGAGRTFADQGGKTPAQLWAEKKARERGLSGASDNAPSSGFDQAQSPMAAQNSGGGDWKSGYAGKTWAPVSTTRTGQSSTSVGEDPTGTQEPGYETSPSTGGGVSAIRDKFKNSAPMGTSGTSATASLPSPPALDTSNKPNAGRGIPIPGIPNRPSAPAEESEAPRLPSPPPQPPRSPTPPTPPAVSGSPIRVAMPVSRGADVDSVENAREEQISPPPAMPTRSLAEAVPHEDDLTEESPGNEPARGAATAAAVASFGEKAVDAAQPGGEESGRRALVQYDYEKAEDNELELKEGEVVSNIEMVDENWWMGQNSRGESGLFPSNYVELVEDEDSAQPSSQARDHSPQPQSQAPDHSEAVPSSGAPQTSQGATATAMYDYEAAEDNELSFPENAKITDVVSPCPFLNQLISQLNNSLGISR